MKSFLVGLVVLILLGFGIFYFIGTETDQLPNTSTQTATTTAPDDEGADAQAWSPSIPSNYRLHVEPDYRYSIGLPYEVDVSSPQPGIARYRYVGPNNEPASEIADGYTITITAETTNENSLGALVSGMTQQSERFTVAGMEARRYVTESELGDKPITNYVFLPGNGYSYQVSLNLSPENDLEYEQETMTILETLQFFEDEVAESLRSRIIPIAMLDYAAVGEQYIRESSNATERGCDSVVLIEHVLDEPTNTPLTESLQQLFSYEQDTVGGWQNFIASQNDTLQFDRAEIENGTAMIYLNGKLGPLGGVCDNPRAAIQIEETALAYDTVGDVELFLNGEPTNLTPSGRGE